MSFIINLTAVLLFANNFLMCMDPIKKNPASFTFITKKPCQEFIIPLDVAKQCVPIKDMVEDISEGSNPIHEWPLQNNSTQAFELVYYLQNIHHKNKLSNSEDTKEENPEKKFFDAILAEQTKTLSSTQLANLFTAVDDLNVIDKDNHCYLVGEVAQRIRDNPAKAEIFFTLNNRPLFRNVVQTISKHINFEKKYIEPYADITVEQQDLERTIPVLTTAWYNITNALTAPIRLFSSYPWATKTTMRPYYLNGETGTMITGFVQKLGPEDNIIRLLITNKKTSKNISVSLALNNISTIKNIEANAAESLFICRTNDNKAIIINTLNKENTVIDQDFVDCVFSDNDHELYVIKNKEFGIWNVQDNTFTLINHLISDKTYTDIKINKQRTNLALCCNKMETWVWKCEETPFKDNVKKLFQDEPLCNICLHPIEDILYIQYYDLKDSVIRNVSININTKKITPLDLRIPETAKNAVIKNNHSFRFLSGTDILFAGPPHGKDYFINTKNNHIWTKGKNKKNTRIFGIRETNTDNDYERIALSTDGTQSIEQTIKTYPLIDFISIIMAKDNNAANFSFKKIVATTLIDRATIQSIKAINEGFLSPQMITALLGSNNTAKTSGHSDQGPQKIMASIDNEWKHTWAKNFFYFTASVIAIPLKLKMDLLAQENKNKPIHEIKKLTLYRIDVGKTVSSVIAGVFLLFCLERIVAQY